MKVICPHGKEWLPDEKNVIHIPIPADRWECSCGEHEAGPLCFVGPGGGGVQHQLAGTGGNTPVHFAWAGCGGAWHGETEKL